VQFNHRLVDGSELLRYRSKVGSGVLRGLREVGQLLGRSLEVGVLALLLGCFGNAGFLFRQGLVDESPKNQGRLGLTMAPFQAASNDLEASTAFWIADLSAVDRSANAVVSVLVRALLYAGMSLISSETCLRRWAGGYRIVSELAEILDGLRGGKVWVRHSRQHIFLPSRDRHSDRIAYHQLPCRCR
jgi:hypothetical protein